MTLQTKRYVLGFAFHRGNVALIFKTKGPSYVIGTWNGIGGKVEFTDLSIEDAMSREFFEETGMIVPSSHWHHFSTQRGVSDDVTNYYLHSLVTHLPDDQDFSEIKNTEGDGEIVRWMSYDDPETIDVFNSVITPNLKWMIPLALDHTTGFLNIEER
jgi:8-oxo-dGTP pyrophosphatase MutT (NUDIX family)